MKTSELIKSLVDVMIIHGDTDINIKVSNRDEYGRVISYKIVPISYVLFHQEKPVIAIEGKQLEMEITYENTF